MKEQAALAKGILRTVIGLRTLLGQATVEGAFLIPVILLLLMLLIQPGILLYDRMVMSAAASEGCRLLATRPAGEYGAEAAYKGYVLNRLGAVPQQDNFHVHTSGCSWVVELTGDESTEQVGVSIETKVKPLPFFDFGAAALGLTDANGYFTQKVQAQRTVYSQWVQGNELGLNPEQWVQENAGGEQ